MATDQFRRTDGEPSTTPAVSAEDMFDRLLAERAELAEAVRNQRGAIRRLAAERDALLDRLLAHD
jgi:NTP pyrophosphatase (non-canonical NTP hydrolase)